jgi:hypothetical protein
MVTIRIISLNVKNVCILPTECMRFVRFGQYTAITSPNSINRMVFLMETQCVYIEEETEFGNIIYNNFIRQRAEAFISYQTYVAASPWIDNSNSSTFCHQSAGAA